MKKIKWLSLIINTLFYTGIIALVLYVTAGFRYFAMPLKSMEPQIKQNDLVVLRYSSKYTPKVNDIVLIDAAKAKNLYQISNSNENGILVTNNDRMLTVTQKQILGEVIFRIPGIGIIIIFLKTKWGLGIILGIIAISFIYRKLAR